MLSVLGLICIIFFSAFDKLKYGNNLNKIRLTEEGALLKAKLLGFKKFIKACDLNKIKTFLEEDPLYVDKVLPYAVVFGLETEFIMKVTPLLQEVKKRYNNYNSYINDDFTSDMTTIRISSTYVKPSYDYSNSSYNHSDSSYSRDSGFSSGSSFSGGGSSFSSGGGGGGGGSKSW